MRLKKALLLQSLSALSEAVALLHADAIFLSEIGTSLELLWDVECGFNALKCRALALGY